MKSCFIRLCAIIMVALCISAPVGAQTEQECGAFCVCVTDESCTSVTGCDASNEGRESTTFTISEMNGCAVKLEVLLSCEDCEQCFACAIIVDAVSGQWEAGLQTGCDDNGCRPNPLTVHLAAGSYKLLACLRMCPAGNCSTCEGCAAKARVYRYSNDCGTTCDW